MAMGMQYVVGGDMELIMGIYVDVSLDFMTKGQGSGNPPLIGFPPGLSMRNLSGVGWVGGLLRLSIAI